MDITVTIAWPNNLVFLMSIMSNKVIFIENVCYRKVCYLTTEIRKKLASPLILSMSTIIIISIKLYVKYQQLHEKDSKSTCML